MVEYNEKYDGFVLRCADNTSLVLTATGSSSGSNVCIQKYDSSKSYQVWTSDAFSLKSSATTTTTTKAATGTKKYTVQFDVNVLFSALSSAKIKDSNGKTYRSSLRVEGYKNSTITIPSATRSGYTLVGWAISSKAEKAAYKAGDSYEITKNVTLYAIWGYKVTFNANGGKASESYDAAVKGHSITLPSAEKSGYDFLGWSTSKNAEKGDYESGAAYTAKGDITLYVVWGKETKWSADYKYWSQGASGEPLMHDGCWVVANARLIYETGIDRTDFNPDVLFTWAKKRICWFRWKCNIWI